MKTKYSGYEWFGDIPETWHMLPIRALYDERRDKNLNNEVTQVLSLLKDIGIVPYEEKGDIGNKMTDTPENHKIVEPGDLVVNKMNAVIGSLGISKYKGTVSQVYFVLRLQNINCNNEYLEYIFKYRGFQRSLKRISKGIMEIRESIDWNEFKNLRIPIPPKNEQDEIVEYIKAQEEKINRFIEKKQRFIELLKEQRQSVITKSVTKGIRKDVELKETGIDWLGQIPMNWEIRRLKRVSKSIQTGSTPKSENAEVHFEGGEINWFTPGDIKDLFINNSNRKITQKAIDDGVVTLFPAKSVLVIGIGGTLGKVSMIEVDGGSNQQINSVTFNDEVLPEFGLYYLSAFESILKSISNAATLAILTQSDLKDMLFLLPSLEEQKQIVSHIKTETATIDTAIAKAEREIELIREYKEAMIAEAVMGKMKL